MKMVRMTLVQFVATLGKLWREDVFYLLTQWERVAFLWAPLPVGGIGYPVQVLERAGWISAEQRERVPLSAIPMETLRRNRLAAWRLVRQNGCVQVTFHGMPVALLVGVPSGDVGWEPVDVAKVISGECLIEEMDATYE